MYLKFTPGFTISIVNERIGIQDLPCTSPSTLKDTCVCYQRRYSV